MQGCRTTADSAVWREQFIRTYLERDIPALGPRIPARTLRRFWTMLAHLQGGLWNAASLARSLAVDGKTVARYVDLLTDLLLVRRLHQFHANVRKRLVKSPKVYVRDSGIVHALARVASPGRRLRGLQPVRTALIIRASARAPAPPAHDPGSR